MMAMMMAVVGFAQPVKLQGKHALLDAGLQKSSVVKAVPSRRMAPRRATEVVTVPESAVIEDFLMSGYMIYWDSNNEQQVAEVNQGVKVAFDGTDVYVQGFGYYVPEGWVKGTLAEDGTVTFATGQYYGSMTYGSTDYDFWFAGYGYDEDTEEEFCVDVPFTYDAEAGTLTQGDVYFMENGKEDEAYYYVLFAKVTLTKVVEKAGMPAPLTENDMYFGAYDESEGYGYFVFVHSLLDTDGNPLVTDKLSYQLFSDVDGTIEPIVYDPALYEKLDEEMSIIPYDFTDNWDFQVQSGQKVVFLNDPVISTYDRIGIKFYYEGGGSQTETEIFWYTIPEEEPVASNGIWVAADQEYNNQEEVTDIVIDEGVTGVFGAGENTSNLVPKYFVAGQAVRMYAGNSLTITSDEPMTEIILVMSVAGDKGASLEADEGELVYDEETTTFTWTGSATEVVFSVPNVSGEQGRIVSITVTTEGGASPIEPGDEELVEIPEDLDYTQWVMTAYDPYYDSDVDLIVNVGFYGNDVYIQGLSYLLPDNWAKGVVNEDGSVSFDTQFLGNFNYYDFELPFYLLASSFTFDAENNVLLAETCQISMSDDETDEDSVWDDYSSVNIQLPGTEAAVPADPAVLDFAFEAQEEEEAKRRAEEEEEVGAGWWYVDLYIPLRDVNYQALDFNSVSYQLFVDVERKVSSYILTPDNYATLSESMEVLPYMFSDDYDVFQGGSRVYLYDENIENWNKIGVKSIYTKGGETHESEIVWYDIKDYTTEPDAISNAISEKDAIVRYFDLQGRTATANTPGVVIKQVRTANGVKNVKVMR